ncbi:hypothetical protein [Actinomadura luteofluorescens]
MIIASEVGTAMDPDNFSHTFSKLAKRAVLGHLHPHELRHSGASLMPTQGTPLHWSLRSPGTRRSRPPRTSMGVCSSPTSGRRLRP